MLHVCMYQVKSKSDSLIANFVLRVTENKLVSAEWDLDITLTYLTLVIQLNPNRLLLSVVMKIKYKTEARGKTNDGGGGIR